MGEPTVRIVAVGDISYNGRFHELLERHGPGFPFRRLAPRWDGADLRLGNLESPLAASAPKVIPSKLTLRGAPRAAESLVRAGFDCVSLANNHTMDYGPAGMAETINSLEGAGIAHHGAGPDADSAHAPVVLERNGLAIGLLAYCDPSSGASMPSGPQRPGVARLDVDACCAAIRALRSAVNHVVVQVHWGQEMCRLPSPEQRATARRMVEAGADLILGHHPHVLQPCEWISGVPVFYSLGNFLFSEMYWRGCNDEGEHFCCKLRIQRECRRAGWVEAVLRPGGPALARLRPARLTPGREVAPDETPARLAEWDRLCRRLDGDYRAESRRAAALRDWSYGSRSFLRRLEVRLFHHGLIPHAVEGD